MSEVAVITEPIDADGIAALPPELRGQAVTLALAQSKEWLTVATRSTDPTRVQEFKMWAAAVEEMTRQKKLSEEIQLDAQEMLRRAERGVALVQAEMDRAGLLRGAGRPEKIPHIVKDFESASSLYSNTREYVDAQDMARGVSDEDFEDVIQEERAAPKPNMSRRNIARKSRERSGREVIPRNTRPARFEVDVGDSACAPPVLREDMIREISEWGFAGRDLIPALSVDERNYMIQVLVKLEGELRTSPVTVVQEEQP